MTRLLVASLLALAGCSDRYFDPGKWKASEFDLTPAESDRKFGIDPFSYWIGEVHASLTFRECLGFLPAQRMKGIWVLDHDESSFIPWATTVPRPDDRLRYRIRLEGDDKAVERMGAPWFPSRPENVMKIDFIGRRTRHAGAYHHGSSDHVVFADSVISARYIGVVPAPDWITALNSGRRIDLDNFERDYFGRGLSDAVWREPPGR